MCHSISNVCLLSIIDVDQGRKGVEETDTEISDIKCELVQADWNLEEPVSSVFGSKPLCVRFCHN